MKVLQINVVYRQGSTGSIVYLIHQAMLEKGYESIVCYGRGSCTSDKNVYKVSSEIYSKWNNLFSRITGFQYGGCIVSTAKLIFLINKYKPDIVHLHCLNGYFVNIYYLIKWLNKHNYHTVLTLHAEFMYTANCAHSFDCEKWKTGCGNCSNLKLATNSYFFDQTNKSWQLMKAAFKGFNNLYVISVSDWLRGRSEASPILGDFNNQTILNGVNVNTFKRYAYSEYANEICQQYDICCYEKTLLHVTAFFSDDINHVKGGYYLIKLAESLPDYQFLVVGNYKLSNTLPNNIKLLGLVENQKSLAYLYNFSDLTILTSKRETFSMVCAESLCCGTPIVGFNAGGPETIALPDYSFFVDYGNVEALKNTVEWASSLSFFRDDISSLSCMRYSSDAMVNNYLNLYDSVVE